MVEMEMETLCAVFSQRTSHKLLFTVDIAVILLLVSLLLSLTAPTGAHMNAAVTFTNCALGRMTWKKFPVYVLGQFLGSFSAAATTYLIFYGEQSSWIVYLQPLLLKHGWIPSWYPVLEEKEKKKKSWQLTM